MKSKKGKSPAKGFPPTAEVLFPMPAGGPYTYGVPEHLADRVVPGVRVVAPLSRRVLTGIVLEVQNGAPPEGIRLKNLQEAVDEKPLLTADLLLLVDWLAGYYFCHRGEALRSVLPSVFFASGDRKISLTGAEPADTVLKALSKSQLEIRQFLKAHGGALPASSLKARFGARKSSLALRELLRQGLAVEEEYRPRLPRQKVQVMVEVSGELPGAGDLESLLERSPRQAECLELLRSLSHPVEQSLLAGRMGFSHQVVNGLVAKGLAVRR
ncbi:MAG: hypothetical protein U9P14_07280, partial [Gemmatimonadota bacterium]|nr:hypothetical protein [Gemmatimonadota bacterium]